MTDEYAETIAAYHFSPFLEKLFARILLNRLSTVAESILPEAQCGFRPGRGTVDMIFSLKQIQEKCIEQNRPLYMVFVDFTKAFDTVHRDTLWKILRKIGCPEVFTDMIASLHNGMKASVSLKGDLSQPFDVLNGVKQGCVLAPTLFSIFLTTVLNTTFDDCDKGVMIQTRPGADLFNVSQFKSSHKTKPVLVRELMFADDTAFVAHTHTRTCRILSPALPPQPRHMAYRSTLRRQRRCSNHPLVVEVPTNPLELMEKT